MPFRVVSGVSRRMDVLDGSGGVNFGRPIVTNGDFVTRLFPNYFEQDLYSCMRSHF